MSQKDKKARPRPKDPPRRTGAGSDASDRSRAPDRTSASFARARRGPTLILTAILLAGLGLRIAYLTTIASAPDVNSPIQDAAFHDYWARGLVTGDWARAEGREDPRINQVPFLRPPAYPYFLAAIYRVFGHSYPAVRIVQMFLGLLTCVLTWLLGKALFNRTVGLIAAGFAAVYWALIYFEAELQDPVLITFVTVASMLLIFRWWSGPSAVRAFLSGLLLAAAALTRPNALVFVPVVLVWLYWVGRSRLPLKRLHRHAAALLLGVVLGIAPATIRNLVVARDPVLISTNGGVNLYIGNNETSDGFSSTIPNLQELTGLSRWNWFLYDRVVQGVSREQGRPMKYSQVSAWFTGKALAFIRSHPGRFAQLCAKRAALFWGPAEVANNGAPDLEKARNPVLRWGPGFPFVLGLAWLGLLILAQERRQRRTAARTSGTPADDGGRHGGEAGGGRSSTGAPGTTPMLLLILLFVLSYFLSFVPFLAAGRFRIPLLPFLFLSGAYALYRLWQWLVARQGRRFAIWLGAGAGLVALCSIPLVPYRSDPVWWYSNRAMALTLAGKPEEALKECEAALEENPGYIDVRLQRASLLTRLGRKAEAVRDYQEVLRSRPEMTDVRVRMASLMIDEGQAASVLPELQKIAAGHPDMPEVHLQIGSALAHLGRYAEAEAPLRRSLELRPDQTLAQIFLGFVLAQRGAHGEAVQHFGEATRLDPGSKEAWFYLGVSLQALGRKEEAEAAYNHAIRIDPKYTVALQSLARLRAPVTDE